MTNRWQYLSIPKARGRKRNPAPVSARSLFSAEPYAAASGEIDIQ
jgi:hypothetical protein